MMASAESLRSLFVVALPRSLSSDVLRLACHALGLREPAWVMEGEILNVDRYAHYRGPRFDESAKFTTRASEPRLHSRMLDLLDQITVAEGFAYKDVIQPFVLSDWRGIERFRVIRIKRDLAEIAYSMLLQGWLYPCAAARQDHQTIRARRLWQPLLRRSPNQSRLLLPLICRSRFIDALLEGLTYAERALDSISGAVIHYDDLIASEDHLRQALGSLYPEVDVPPLRYMDGMFLWRRERVLARRRTSTYRDLAARRERLQLDLRGTPAALSPDAPSFDNGKGAR